MKITMLTRTLAIGIVAITMAGCQQNTGSSIAIVDLEVVAEKLGKSKEMQAKIEQRQQQLNQSLQQAKSSVEEQLQSAANKLGDKPDDAAKQQYRAMEQEGRKRLESLRVEGENEFTSFRLKVVQEFRDAMKPLSLNVAKQNGCSIVLTKTDTVVFAYSNEVDITDRLVKAIQSGHAPKSVSKPNRCPDSRSSITKHTQSMASRGVRKVSMRNERIRNGLQDTK